MNKPENIFSKYELPLFFLLTYLLSWWIVPLLQGGMLAQGPAFAAVIIIALTAGRQGLREFWGRVTRSRAGWWYLIGPAIIIGYQGAAFGINLLLGATITEFPQLPSIGTFLQLLLFGGLWEEFGWTGYILPKLQERFASLPNGRVIAALVLGIFRAIWHLPLFLYGKIFWFDILIFEVAVQVIIAWLYNRSGGSVLVVVLFHFTSNIMGSVMSPVFTGVERTAYYAIFMTLASLIALVIAWKSQFKLG